MIGELLIGIASAVAGGGATAAIITTRGSIKLKRMDIAAQERQQFINEINDLRTRFAELYDQHLDLKKQNAHLEMKLEKIGV